MNAPIQKISTIGKTDLITSGLILILYFATIVLLILYRYLYKKLEYKDLVRQEQAYNKATLQKLVDDAISQLKLNISFLSDPYFNIYTVQKILKIWPDYIVVLKYAKYVSDNDIDDKVTRKLINNATVDVTIKVTEFRETSYKRELLYDLQHSVKLYNDNKIYVSKQIKSYNI